MLQHIKYDFEKYYKIIILARTELTTTKTFGALVVFYGGQYKIFDIRLDNNTYKLHI